MGGGQPKEEDRKKEISQPCCCSSLVQEYGRTQEVSLDGESRRTDKNIFRLTGRWDGEGKFRKA